MDLTFIVRKLGRPKNRRIIALAIECFVVLALFGLLPLDEAPFGFNLPFGITTAMILGTAMILVIYWRYTSTA